MFEIELLEMENTVEIKKYMNSTVDWTTLRDNQ